MPFQFYQLPDEPIVIFEITGAFTLTDAEEIVDHSAKFKQIHRTFYCIADTRSSYASFVEVFRILRLVLSRYQPGTAAEPKMIGILVDTHTWAMIIAELVKTPAFHNRPVAIFSTQEDAIKYARLHQALYGGSV